MAQQATPVVLNTLWAASWSILMGPSYWNGELSLEKWLSNKAVKKVTVIQGGTFPLMPEDRLVLRP